MRNYCWVCGVHFRSNVCPTCKRTEDVMTEERADQLRKVVMDVIVAAGKFYKSRTLVVQENVYTSSETEFMESYGREFGVSVLKPGKTFVHHFTQEGRNKHRYPN